jgi:hypothetical protein
MTIFDDWEFFARMARENEGAFVDVSTAVNRGHDEPGRLTRCSSLSKAKCYLEMLERVWLADARFCLDHPDVVRRAESAAALAVAESALLAGQRTEVQNALARWRRVDGHQAAARAAALALSASLPGGRGLFRAARLGQKLFKRAWSGSKHRRSLVNPTA